MSRILACLLLFVTSSAFGETWTADFESYNARRQDMMSRDEYGPFTWSGGVAMNYPGRGFAADGDSFVKVSSPREYGPLTITTNAPAWLDGGWFGATRQIGFIADIDYNHPEMNTTVYVDATESWMYADLNIAFLHTLTIVGCDPHGTAQDFECFWNDQMWTDANVDELEFTIAIAEELSEPNGPDELPPSSNNVIPEPTSFVLAFLYAATGYVLCISRRWWIR